MGKVWVVEALALNSSTELLDFTDFTKQFKSLVFGNLKWVFRMFAFIQANIFFFKCYLCYKIVTSQSVSSDAQVKNFFIS